MERLMKNRVSAKKCRQKKKLYLDDLEVKVKYLEKELEKYNSQSSIEKLIDKLEKTENQISNSKQLNINMKSDYQEIQNAALSLLFKKMINTIIPIEFKNFGNKFIKFIEIGKYQNIDELFVYINENQEILKEIFSLKREEPNPNKALTLPEKFFNFFEKLKTFSSLFNEISTDLATFEKPN